MLREIKISRGKVVIVDDEDFERLSVGVWHAVTNHPSEPNWYARNSQGVYMHREILAAPPGCEVDHKDHNGLNNTRGNLRLCTGSLNRANVIHPTPASGYRGVYWEPKRKTFVAQTTVDSKTITIGRFTDALLAARERDIYVLKVFGEFAVLNFPELREVA